MIELKRIVTILKAHDLSPNTLAQITGLSQSKISKILTGNQTFSAPAIGALIKEFEIYPNWLFGYEGISDEVMYVKDLVSRDEVEKLQKEIHDLKLELGEVYKQLAEERRAK